MRGLACSLLVAVGLLSGCGTNGGRGGAAAQAKAAALEKGDAQARLIAQLAPRLEQKSASLTPVTRADGGRSLRVNGHFSQAQMARVDASGVVTATCVDNVTAAARFVEGDAAGAKP